MMKTPQAPAISPQKKVAAILVRVSTAIQSFERQLVELSDLAKAMEYTIPEGNTYAEKISGFKKTDERLELTRLLNDIKGGKKIDMIFVSEISRIARDPKAGRDVIEELMALKVPVYIQNIKMATLNEDGSRNSMFSIIFQILIEFANTESEYTKARIKSGKLHNFKEGRNLGGEFIPYGYTVAIKDSEKKAAKLIPDEKEAKIVKQVFQMCIDGVGYKNIAYHMNDKNTPTRTGVKWSVTTVRQMVVNPIYYGTREYKGTWYDKTVPAIITKEIFEAATKSRAKRTLEVDPNMKYLYLLKGKCYCGMCGAKYIAKFRPKKHSHYMCFTRYKNVRGEKCENAGIGIDRIESFAWWIVRMQMGVARYLKDSDKEKLQKEKEIENIKIQLKTYETELSIKNEEKRRWQKLFVTNKISEAELEIEHGRIETTIKNVKDKILKVKKDIEVKTELLTKYEAGVALVQANKFEDEIGTDRVKINEIIPVLLDKLIITSVPTDKQQTDEYLIMAYYVGSKFPTIFLYYKKSMEFIFSRKMAKQVEIDENGIFKSDIQEVKNLLLQRDMKRIKVAHVPFTRLDKNNNYAVVPTRK